MAKDLFLFLDVDGVLNDSFWLSRRNRTPGDTETWHAEQFDPEAVERLNKIIDHFGFKVVLSSTWRMDGLDNVQRWMDSRGFRHRLLDRTPILHVHRGLEIQNWMDEHKVEATQIIILDDDHDMAHLMWRLVSTRFHHEQHPVKGLIRGGLLDMHFSEIEELLERGQDETC